MQIDRHIKLFGARIDRPELPVVDEFAVGKTVNHGALEAERHDATLQFVGRSLRLGGRQRRKARKPRRMRRNRLMQPVVDAPRQRDRDVGADFLRGRRAVGQHLDVDAGIVHFLEPQRAEIIETPLRLPGPAGFDAGEMRRQLGVPIVLLNRDNRTFRLGQHSRFPTPLSDLTPSAPRIDGESRIVKARVRSNESQPASCPRLSRASTSFLPHSASKTWMAGTSPAMTPERWLTI